MSCSNTAVFSRGDSFSSVWTWAPNAGEPANLIGTTVQSTLQDRAGKDHELVVVIAVDGLSFTATYPDDTSEWALGLASWDFRFTFPGGPVTHSTIFRVQIQETITQA